MIDAILFDMDGTLVNTECFNYYVALEYFERKNINFSKQALLQYMDAKPQAIREIYENISSRFNWKEYIAHKTAFFTREIDGPNFFKAGSIEMLEFCKANNIKTAIVSGSNRVAINYYLSKNKKLQNCIDVIVPSDEIYNDKPNPEGFLKALELLGAKSENTLVIEDSMIGIEAGYLADCRVVYVPDIIVYKQEYKRYIYRECDTLFDVIKLIKNENQII